MRQQQQHTTAVIALATTTLAITSIGALIYRYFHRRHQEAARSRQSPTTDKNNHDDNKPAPRRFGGAIRLVPDKYMKYRQLHDHVWDHVLQRMYQSNIRNFTIYYHAETSTMFQSFEWIGHWSIAKNNKHDAKSSKEAEDALFQADMKAIADDPVVRKWWKECEPCQEPFSQWIAGSKLLSDGGTGDWWAPLECVNHCGHWPVAYSKQQRDPDFVKMKEGRQAVESTVSTPTSK